MHPIDFEGSNIMFGKPADMTDEQCSSCPAFVLVDADNFPFTLVALQPNKEDIEAICAGRPIFLKFIGSGLRPFAAYTLNENNEPNI